MNQFKSLKSAALVTVTAAATMLLIQACGGGAVAQSTDADPVEGSWEAVITVRDCATGTTILTARGQEVFHRGGTLTDTNAAPPTTRGVGFGTWQRDATAQNYTSRFRFNRYNIDQPARRGAAEALPANQDFTLEQYVKVLATSPLDSQPGTVLRYGPATEVLGRLVEVVSGRSLPEFFAERIFQPLGMVDTSFIVPVDKRSRVVTAYARSAGGVLVPVPPFAMAPKFFSAAGNVFSTPMDYLRFCQMLLGGGQGLRGADGKTAGPRLLGRKSVELMTARHVESFPAPFLAGQHAGLGVAVRTAGGESGLIGSAGAYGWSGGNNTYFRIDPQERLILMLFVQQAYVPGDQELQFSFHNTVMQAVDDRQPR
jgi:CubicO group peptidase (beta-lactamase class C family)